MRAYCAPSAGFLTDLYINIGHGLHYLLGLLVLQRGLAHRQTQVFVLMCACGDRHHKLWVLC